MAIRRKGSRSVHWWCVWWRDLERILQPDGVPFLSVTNNFALQLNVDWFKPFKHTQHSEGAIQCKRVDFFYKLACKVLSTYITHYQQFYRLYLYPLTVIKNCYLWRFCDIDTHTWRIHIARACAAPRCAALTNDIHDKLKISPTRTWNFTISYSLAERYHWVSRLQAQPVLLRTSNLLLRPKRLVLFRTNCPGDLGSVVLQLFLLMLMLM